MRMLRFSVLCYHLLDLFGLIFIVSSSSEISCRDGQDNPVDWFINYKMPKTADDGRRPFGDVEEGVVYTSLTSKYPYKWYSSWKGIDEKGSMLWNTMDEFYQNKQEYTYLFYNDQPPGEDSTRGQGHSKGVLVFGRKTGFWIIHSFPRFPDTEEFFLPESALRYGQMALCVTFRTSELAKICEHLLYCSPYIYARRKANGMFLNTKAYTIFTDRPDIQTKEPFMKITKFKSLANKTFIGFAKDNQDGTDIYEDIISPELDASFAVETWRRGTFLSLQLEGLKLNTDDTLDVLIIQAVDMPVQTSNGPRRYSFPTVKDHSKWAVSKEKNWVCISDLNHQKSQRKRGGGALCFQSEPVAEAFRTIIAKM